jgi:membrane fusion protein (multidrug efflux system)
MSSTNVASSSDRDSEPPIEPRSDRTEAAATETETTKGSLAARANQAARADHDAAPMPGPAPSASPRHPWRKRSLWAAAAVALALGGYWLVPIVRTMLNTISTDDAYVNGHVTFVAPRVAGQVKKVFVDDNYRVRKGAVLVQLDKEPYEVQLAIKQAAVVSAEADLGAAEAQVRGLEALGGSQRWQLESAMERVASQIATLRANVATHESNKAHLELSRANLKRGEQLAPSGGISKEEVDVRKEAVKADDAAVVLALQAVYATRVSLGLPPKPAKGDLTDVPPDLDQTFSGVRTALYNLIQTMAQIGMNVVREKVTPRQFLAEFRQTDPGGDVDRVLERLVPSAPAVKQAKAKLLEAKRDLAQAELNLRYCDIISEIDGVVTRRNVNPGNDVQVGQGLMAVRSLTEIWIDANFKETQLRDLRIGQRVRCNVDMYGSHREYTGRITGFTMGTGSTLALLPAQNATGNFVKIVQRLPVRIELTDYDPDSAPVFVGLSVVPYVYYKESPTGPHAGQVLQPLYSPPEGAPVAGDGGVTSRPNTPISGGPSGP